jgi:hypothetical protein
MIEYYPGADQLWYWRYRANNGQVTCTGHEGYATKWNAKRAARKTGLSLVFASSREGVRK